MLRAALPLLLALLALPLWAKTVWLVGKDAPVDASAVAEALAPMLGGEEGAEVGAEMAAEGLCGGLAGGVEGGLVGEEPDAEARVGGAQPDLGAGGVGRRGHLRARRMRVVGMAEHSSRAASQSSEA